MKQLKPIAFAGQTSYRSDLRVQAGKVRFQTIGDLNASPRTTVLYLDYVQWLFKLPDCFSPRCTKSSKRRKNTISLCVSLNAKLSSVQVFTAVINPPP